MKNIVAIGSVSAVLLVCGLSISATSAQMVRGSYLPSPSTTKVVQTKPVIKSVTPSVSAGQTVTIKGERLSGGIILIDGSVPKGLAYKDGNGSSLSFTVPSSLSAGNHSLAVKNNLKELSNALSFRVKAASPVINSLSPVGGEAYKVGDTVTVSWDVSNLTASNNSLGLAVYRKSTGPTRSVVSKTVGNPVVNGKVSSAGKFSWKIGTSTPAASDYVVYLSTATGYKQSAVFSVAVVAAPTSTPLQAQNREAVNLTETFVGVGIIASDKAALAREMASGTSATTSLFQLVETFIGVGIVSSDKASAARAAVTPVSDNAKAGPEFSLVGVPSITKNGGPSTQLGATTTVTAWFNVSILARGDDYSFTQAGSFLFSVYKNGVKTPVDGSFSSFSIPSAGVVTSGLPAGAAFKVAENNQVTVPVHHTFVLPPGSGSGYQVELEKINYMGRDGKMETRILASSTPHSVWRTSSVVSSAGSNSALASVSFAVEDLVRLISALR